MLVRLIISILFDALPKGAVYLAIHLSANMA